MTPFKSSAIVSAWVAFLLLGACMLGAPLSAQAKVPATDGPVIHGYGAVWDIPTPDLETPLEFDYNVLFEVHESSTKPGDVNVDLNTVARFLNMQVRAGVPRDRIHLAVVMHGAAAKDALDAETFQGRYKTANRNENLLRQLMDAGVDVYMCGQSAMSRDVPRDHMISGVKLALSAMTTIAVLKSRGYVTVN